MQIEDHDQKNAAKGLKKGLKFSFKDEMKRILYAFGDVDENPLDETVDAQEEYLFDFLDKFLTQCGKRMNRRDANSTRISKEDVLFQIKDDPKWLARLADIMNRKEEIKVITKNAFPKEKQNLINEQIN